MKPLLLDSSKLEFNYDSKILSSNNLSIQYIKLVYIIQIVHQ